MKLEIPETCTSASHWSGMLGFNWSVFQFYWSKRILEPTHEEHAKSSLDLSDTYIENKDDPYDSVCLPPLPCKPTLHTT